jgi:hypothetical protein
MHYIFRYWYVLVYINAYLFIIVIVIVFILCSDPIYSMIICVLFQFDLIVALSCVISVTCLFLCVFICICYLLCHSVLPLPLG